jgi:hypothetical protein
LGRLTPCLEELCFHVTSSSLRNANTSTTSPPQRPATIIWYKQSLCWLNTGSNTGSFPL